MRLFRNFLRVAAGAQASQAAPDFKLGRLQIKPPDLFDSCFFSSDLFKFSLRFSGRLEPVSQVTQQFSGFRLVFWIPLSELALQIKDLLDQFGQYLGDLLSLGFQALTFGC